MGKDKNCPYCDAPRKEIISGSEWVFNCECYKKLVVLTQEVYDNLKKDAEGWEEPKHFSEDI